MKREISYFIKELKRHYTIKFILYFLSLILILLAPLLLVASRVQFAPAEFANIYVSTVFSSLLIGIILQIIELYKSSVALYLKTYDLIISMDKVVNKIIIKIEEEDKNLPIYGDLLNHYKNAINNSLTSDNEINEIILLLYNRDEITYIVESLKKPINLSTAKKNELQKQLTILSKFIKKTILKL